MHLIFRTDASTQIGTGHVMRCLALAQAWQDAGGDASFIMAACPVVLEERLLSERIPVLHLTESITHGSEADAHETAAIARERGAEWIVVDGYHFGTDYQQSLQSLGLRILFWDDNAHCPHYSADLVLNQNLQASRAMYPSIAPSTNLLLGSQYVALRREFNSYRNWQREIARFTWNILITMGGSDPANLTPRVIDALNTLSRPPSRVKSHRIADSSPTPTGPDDYVEGRFDVTVIVGGSNENIADVEAAVARSKHDVTLIRNSPDMPELMATADLAISAGGSTAWELCLMGLPSVLIPAAENQIAGTQRLHELGGCMMIASGAQFSPSELGLVLMPLTVSAHTRSILSRNARALVDGLGAERVIAHLLGKPEPAPASKVNG